jgi:ABC-2 type transport system permease protein
VTPTGTAPFSRLVLAQARAELTMTLRRGESVLVTIFIPLMLLFFAMALNIAPSGHIQRIDFFMPGIFTAAIMSTGMVSLGIATAYERYYGVLKRLGSSPLPRSALILAKIISVLALEVCQIVLLSIVGAIFYSWRPSGSFLLTLLIVLLGTAVFAGLGMLMAGALRAEATLAVANGLYLLFLFIGGVVIPVDHLPSFFRAIAQVLPAAALSDALRGALTSGVVPGGSVLLLIIWGVVILAAAVFTFKWE